MNLTINDFEGPLDLLLHLIKTKKQDIYNIDITLITKEYLNFIQNKELTIDASSEYLVMASELIHLKSKLLLNKDIETDEVYEFQNPDELAARLMEYEKIKNLANDFRNLETKRGEVYTKLPSSLNEYNDDKMIPNSDISLTDLLSAFEEYLTRKKQAEPINTHITSKEMSVDARTSEVRKLLKNNQGKIKFNELFEELSKPYVIVTFLSILNMAKDHEIKIIQKNNFNDIYVEWGKQE